MKFTRFLRTAVSVLLLVSLLCCCVPLSGCRHGTEKAEINIVATVFPAYDFVRELIAGIPEISVSLLLRPGTESHTYDPSVSDALAISECDLLVYAGGDADLWVEKFINSGVSGPERSFALIDAVNEKLMIEGEDEEDPHVWTDPNNVILIVNALAGRLAAVAGDRWPDSAVPEKINANCSAYVQELEALDRDIRAVSDMIPQEKRLLAFGDRFPFRYFCNAYGFTACAVFPGCAEESEPAAADVKRVVDAIRENGLDTVFYVELSSHRIADAIAAETGCSTACLNSCHNLSKEEFDAGETYLTLMRRNIEVLAGLAGRQSQPGQ